MPELCESRHPETRLACVFFKDHKGKHSAVSHTIKISDSGWHDRVVKPLYWEDEK